MSRRLQRVFKRAPALSAVLCAATVLLWARSCWPDWADRFALRTFGGSGLTADRNIPWDPRDGVKVQFSDGRGYISWATHTNKPALAGHNGCLVDDGIRGIGWDCAGYLWENDREMRESRSAYRTLSAGHSAHVRSSRR